MKPRKLRKMLAPLKAFEVEKAKVRCLNTHPVVTESWKRGYTRVIKEVHAAITEKIVTVRADEGASGGERQQIRVRTLASLDQLEQDHTLRFEVSSKLRVLTQLVA